MLLAGSTRYPSVSSNGERNSPHAAGLTLRFTIHNFDVRKGTQSEAFASVDFERAVGHREDQAGSVAEQMRDSPEPPERPGEPSRETGCVPPKREIHGPGEPSTGPIRDGSPHRKQPPASPRGSVQRVPPPDPNLRRGWPERKSFGSLLGGTILEAGHPIGSNRRPAELHRIPTTAPPARQHGHVAGFARDVVVVPVRSAPQSTAVASTRGNIVVPPKREIHGPGEPSTGLIRDGSPHRKQPPKREIHGPGEPSTGRYKYDHPGYQSTGQSHMPLPKRPHRSPNSDANKTCPVPGFARDVVTVRSAVDLLGGGYRPVQISWKRFRSAVLRGTGRPGEEGRGENPAPLLYLEIVGTPESEYGKRRAPKGSGRRQHHRPTSAAGCRDRYSAGAPLSRFLRRYGESCASSERRDREPAAWTGPASGRDPGSAGAPPLPSRRNTTLERHGESGASSERRDREPAAWTGPASGRDPGSAGAPPLPLRRNTTLERHGESGASSERRDREPAAWTGPASGRDPGSAGAPPLPLRRNTTLERHGESGASSERRDREPAAWTGPASGRDPGSAGAPPLPLRRNTTLQRHGESGASSERRDREPAAWTGPASGRDSDSAGARRVPFRSEAPAREVPRRNAGTASTPPGPGRATSRYTKTREGSSRALIRGPSTSFVHSHPAPRARGELLSNLGSAARSSTHLPLYRATGVPAILETFFVSGALRHDACRRGGEGTESRAVS
ncbi:hypothetical protein TNCT_678201 [Trichonephila clavata]|uniref:Uncharacterized protein n=1 Tax=Trichonephila clavata TaxID=2740835 RepID=A0A8X6FTZ4_TRICU|nr:hypothetical protein TNCT_678201 [Trichonephila clavata]